MKNCLHSVSTFSFILLITEQINPLSNAYSFHVMTIAYVTFIWNLPVIYYLDLNDSPTIFDRPKVYSFWLVIQFECFFI